MPDKYDVVSAFLSRKVAIEFHSTDIDIAEQIQEILNDAYGAHVYFVKSGPIYAMLKNRRGTLYIAFDTGSKRLGYVNGDPDYYRSRGLDIIPAEEFLEMCNPQNTDNDLDFESVFA